MEKIDGTVEELFEKIIEIKDVDKPLKIISEKLVHLVDLLNTTWHTTIHILTTLLINQRKIICVRIT